MSQLAAGSSRHPRYLAALAEIRTIIAELQTATAELTAAATSARAFQDRLR